MTTTHPQTGTHAMTTLTTRRTSYLFVDTDNARLTRTTLDQRGWTFGICQTPDGQWHAAAHDDTVRIEGLVAIGPFDTEAGAVAAVRAW